MKLVKTQDAEGLILCHDLTRIVKDESKGPAFRKGHIVEAEDIPILLSMGKENLYVWEKEEGMLHENEAAEILYQICAGEWMEPTPVKEGKIEVVTTVDGLLQVDVEKLRAVNSIGQMMIATRHSNFPVKKGDHLAGTRVIPLVIDEALMKQAQLVAGEEPILQVHPYSKKTVGIVTTGSEVYKGLIKDTFTPVIKEKLAYYGAVVSGQEVLPDDDKLVTSAILGFIDSGVDMVICTGGMSVDPDDRNPLAIKNTGAEIVSYGSPVLPGAMFLLSYFNKGGKKIPILGLPGCVMYAEKTIFDIVLPRLMANVVVTADDLAALGNGGLCLKCKTCIFPNCAFGAGI